MKKNGLNLIQITLLIDTQNFIKVRLDKRYPANVKIRDLY